MARIDHNTETHVNTGSNFDPLPAGWYLMTLDKSPAKENEGKFRISYEFTVLEGDFANRKLFGGFNMAFPDPVSDGQQTALNISKDQLNQLVKACGKTVCGDTEELHGIPVLGKVKYKPAKGNFDEGNEIVAFKPANEEAAPAPKAEGASPVKKAAPWGKKGA